MAEIADNLLPVFPFRVNWRGGVTERLEWATNVHAGITGNEQRQATRLTPRREFEVTITVWEQERQFLDLWLHRMVGTDCLLPLWHDSVRIDREAAQGDSEVWADTRGLEWEIGSYGLLRGLTALSHEVVEIAGVEDERLLLAAPLGGSWPKGTRIEPLRRGRLSENTKPAIKGDRAWECQALFQLTREQPYDDTLEGLDLYAGIPVLHTPPNRVAALDAEFEWGFAETDSKTGRRYRQSDADRAMVRQKHEWLLHGRTRKAAFRRFLYYMRGRQRVVWLPTYSADLTLSRNAGVAASSIYIKAMGFAYTGGPTSGREFICIQRRNGTRLFRRITGTANAGSMAEERLTLDVPLPAGLTMAEVNRISWMDTARFDADRLEFNHVNAADGASTIAATFRTFRNERTVPPILSAPIPKAAISANPCGFDEGDPCAPMPNIFEGWDYEILTRFTVTHGKVGGLDRWEVFGPSGRLGAFSPFREDTGPLTWQFTDRWRGPGADAPNDSSWGDGTRPTYFANPAIGTGVGDWFMIYDPTIVDYIPGVTNRMRHEVFFRHWTEETPRRVFFADFTTASGPAEFGWNNQIPWAPYRTDL